MREGGREDETAGPRGPPMASPQAPPMRRGLATWPWPRARLPPRTRARRPWKRPAPGGSAVQSATYALAGLVIPYYMVASRFSSAEPPTRSRYPWAAAQSAAAEAFFSGLLSFLTMPGGGALPFAAFPSGAVGGRDRAMGPLGPKLGAHLVHGLQAVFN